MRSSLASLVLMMIAVALASGCQSPPPTAAVASPVAPSAITNPTVACERGCSLGYDSCLDAPQGAVGEVGAGGHSEPVVAPSLNEICPDQLKACLRRCLN